MEHLVCIVDDDVSVRRSLVRLFRSSGFVAEVFASADEYLSRAVYNGPSCLILDVQMPGLNGLDLQSALLENGRDEQIIFITGNGDIPMCARALKAGAVDFLPKPFDDTQLLAAVERALVRSATRRLQRATQSAARQRLETLSPRELQVFENVIAGMLNKEIAAELGTSIKTVKIQRGHVMEKMGVVSVADLVRLAEQARSGPSDKV